MKVATAIATVASADNEEESVSGWVRALSVVLSEEALLLAGGNEIGK